MLKMQCPVVMRLVRSASKNRSKGCSEIFGKPDVMKDFGLIVNGKDCSFGFWRDICGKDVSLKVDDWVKIEVC